MCVNVSTRNQANLIIPHSKAVTSNLPKSVAQLFRTVTVCLCKTDSYVRDREQETEREREKKNVRDRLREKESHTDPMIRQKFKESWHLLCLQTCACTHTHAY